MRAQRYAIKVYNLRVTEANLPRGRIDSPEEAKGLLRAYFQALRDDRERFVALALTAQNGLIGLAEISTGGVTGTLVDAKVLFRMLLVMGATRFILSHNHPSGDSKPSKDDILLTDRLCNAAQLLELDCLDHLIVGDGTNDIVSFAETGRMNTASERP